MMLDNKKQEKQAVNESERKFRSLFESIIDPVNVIDKEFRVVMTNKQFMELKGLSRDEIIDKHCYNVYQGRETKCDFCVADEIFSKRKPDVVEKQLFLPDGSSRIFEIHGYPIFDEKGEVYQVFEILRDITERKQHQEMVEAEKERLSVTLRSIGDGVITTDTSGKILLMNKVAENLTGWTAEEARGKQISNVFKVINALTRQPCENPVEKVLNQGSIVELANHTHLISKDGREMIITDSGAPIRDRNSRIIGVVLVFRDVTEKQKLLENLQKTQKLDLLSVIAGGIAHDFNNLLGGIFGYIEMAKGITSDEKVLKCLSKAVKVYDRAKNLTQQLLAFTKGGLPVKKTGSLALLLREASQFALSGSSVSCEFAFPDDLWLCDFDENQIGQVIDNIVINAKQSMPLGGKVFIRAENVFTNESMHFFCKGGYVKVSFMDNGCGIPKENMHKIFDPFFTTKKGGSGLGLATAYSILQKHDGYIEVESEYGEGSTFNLYIPASARLISELSKKELPVHKGKGKVLVMDDEEFNLEIAGEMLSNMGYEVVCAKNGEEAVALFKSAYLEKRSFDIVILDLTIQGGIGGKEVIKELVKLKPFVFSIASSGYSNDPVMASPKSFGFTGSIIKPYKRNELEEVLSRLFLQVNKYT